MTLSSGRTQRHCGSVSYLDRTPSGTKWKDYERYMHSGRSSWDVQESHLCGGGREFVIPSGIVQAPQGTR